MSDEIAKMFRDADMIFTAISTGNFDNYQQAEAAVVAFYIPDMSFSRGGISLALKKLEEHYATI